jgi:hypothetical protein
VLYFPGGTAWPTNDEVQYKVNTAPGLPPPEPMPQGYRSLGYFPSAVAFAEEKMFRTMKQVQYTILCHTQVQYTILCHTPYPMY